MSEEGGKQWVEFRPRWASHVLGEYTERTVDTETMIPEPQKWKATCEICKETWGPATCDSGMVRSHISKFAIAHAHRNPLTQGIPPRKD